MLKRFGVLGLVIGFALSIGCGPGQPGDPIVPDPATIEGGGELPEGGAEGVMEIG